MLVYTFRTYPFIEELKKIFPDVFIFGNLKEDMTVFKQLLKKGDEYILGIADTKSSSRIEPTAINKFNKGKLEAAGPDQVALFIDPRLKGIKVAQYPTTTFCNWTMYRIQRFIDSGDVSSNFSFVHINVKDLGKLRVLTW